MHRAPVVGIVVLDGHGAPLPEPLEVAHDLARSPDMQGSHHLLVISEEQFKVRRISVYLLYASMNDVGEQGLLVSSHDDQMFGL